MPNTIHEVIELINKTGDSCIVLDADANPAYVILPFAEYKKIIENRDAVTELTEEELLNKINRDIALWRQRQESELGALERSDFMPEKIDSVDDAELPAEEETAEAEVEKYYFEPIE